MCHLQGGLDICNVSAGMKRVREAHGMQVQEAAADPDAPERVRQSGAFTVHAKSGISVVHAIVPQLLDHHVLHEIFRAVLAQFDNEISKDLKPRLARTGDEDLLQPFLDYFEGKSFEVGTSLLALWEGRLPYTMMGIEGITVWAML